MAPKEIAAGDAARLRGAAVEAAAGGAQAECVAPLGSALRGGAVYAGAAAFQRGIVFLLLPVYTRVLDPSAYGRLSVLLAIATAAIILLSSGMDTAFFRTYFGLREDPERQRRFVATAWVFLLTVPPVAAAALALVAAPFLAHSDVVPADEFALAVAGAALFVSATVVPLALLRAEERLRDYVALAAMTAGATSGLTLVAVVTLNGGVVGWLLAVIVANAATLGVAVRLIPLRLSDGLDHRLLGGALALGLPLVPHVLSHWGLGVSNRVLLAGMVSTTQVGVYALAANIALPVAIFMQGMAQGFMPAYARAATEKAALRTLPRLINVQYVLVLTIATAGTLIGPIAVRYLAPPEYSAAAHLVPWMTAGYGLLGLYFLPMNAVALTAGRTGKVWIVTALAVGVNFACLFALVPAYGLSGAAIAMTVGYFVLLVGVALYSHGPDNSVRYDWARLVRGLAAFVAVYIMAVTISGDRSVSDACIRLACLCGALPLLVLTGAVERNQIANAIRRVSSRRRLAASA